MNFKTNAIFLFLFILNNCLILKADEPQKFMDPRNAVVEFFTNTGSFEGAKSYSVLSEYIRNHPDKIVPIVYHTYYPYSYDLFYQNNKQMNINRWSQYSKLYNLSLDNSIVVGGQFYSSPRINYDSIFKAIEKQNEILAPVKMSLVTQKTNDSISIKVNVQSVSDYGVRTLYLYLMDTYFSRYDLHSRWDDELRAPNKELFFQWIPRAMIPDENGIKIELREGSDTTISIKYPLKSSYHLKNDKVYVTAVLQSPTSGDLIQAISDYKPLRANLYFAQKEVSNYDSTYITLPRGKKTNCEFFIENPYPFEQKYSVEFYRYSKITSIFLNIFSTQDLILKPYEKKKFSFSAITQLNAEFSKIDMIISPDKVPANYQKDAIFHSIYLITDSIKCVTLYTYDKLEDDAEALHKLNDNYFEKWAICPYDIFLKGFSKMPIKMYYLMLNTKNITSFNQNPERFKFAKELLNDGKGVIITSNFELGINDNLFQNKSCFPSEETRTFLEDDIGISLGMHINTFRQNSYIPIDGYGLAESEFGSNVTTKNLKINGYKVISLTKEIESMKLTNKNPTTKPFLKYSILDFPEDEYAGITSEIGTGRLAYIGFGLENSSFLGRKYIIENLIYWLTKEKKPKRANIEVTPKYVIDFGTNDLLKETIKGVQIKNTGDTTLIIDSILISDFKESFSYDSNAIKYILLPNESFVLPVKFKPMKRQNMRSDLEIYSNSYYSSALVISLIGKGQLPNGIIPETKYEFNIRNSNQYETTIEFYNYNKSDEYKIYLVDSENRKFELNYDKDEVLTKFRYSNSLFKNEYYHIEIENIISNEIKKIDIINKEVN